MQYSIGGNNRFTQLFRYYIARDGVYAAILSGTGAAIAKDGVYVAILPGAGAVNVI